MRAKKEQGREGLSCCKMEERRTKPMLCYLLKSRLPYFLPPPPPLPCSLTLGANSCSLINYWCSEAVVRQAGSGFQWGGFQWPVTARLQCGEIVVIPTGQAKKQPSPVCLCVYTHMLVCLLVCTSGARLTKAVTVICNHLSVRLGQPLGLCLLQHSLQALKRWSIKAISDSKFFKCKLIAPLSRKGSECNAIVTVDMRMLLIDFRKILNKLEWKSNEKGCASILW